MKNEQGTTWRASFYHSLATISSGCPWQPGTYYRHNTNAPHQWSFLTCSTNVGACPWSPKHLGGHAPGALQSKHFLILQQAKASATAKTIGAKDSTTLNQMPHCWSSAIASWYTVAASYLYDWNATSTIAQGESNISVRLIFMTKKVSLSTQTKAGEASTPTGRLKSKGSNKWYTVVP